MKLTANFAADSLQDAYRATLTVLPSSENKTSFAYVYFSIAQPLDPDSIDGGQLEERIGDLHKILLDFPYTGDSELILTFSGSGDIKKASDYPAGVFLASDHSYIDVELERGIKRIWHEAEKVESKSAVFIPVCSQQSLYGEVEWSESVNFKAESWNISWLQRLLGRLAESPVLNSADTGWPIIANQVASLTVSFELKVSSDDVVLTYKDDEGFQVGQAYFFQYLLQLALAKNLKATQLQGSPRFEYRGVHLDVVRHFFQMDSLMQWLDLFALFQFNHFHWHLTDDDGWRLQSEAYPNLTETGAWRGMGERLPPQMGTGFERYGGFYTQGQAKDLVLRAASLGVTVVPEMDLPGHARALLKSIPELVEEGDGSEYRSVQHHNDNVLNPALKATQPILETLVSEWCEIFPGKLFHIGADEVPKGVWEKSPAAESWRKAYGASSEQLLGIWVSKMEIMLEKQNKIMAGWEEVRDGHGASTDTWIFSWQGIEAGVAAAEAGHPVVMTPAQHCYFDLSVTEQFVDPGYWWAGTVNLKKVYEYDPTEGLSSSATKNIKGVQYCLWSELVETSEEAEFMWFPRLFAGAQVVWGNNTNEAYGIFLDAAKGWANVLSHLEIGVRSEKMGW